MDNLIGTYEQRRILAIHVVLTDEKGLLQKPGVNGGLFEKTSAAGRNAVKLSP
jgi:hypothetical protein